MKQKKYIKLTFMVCIVLALAVLAAAPVLAKSKGKLVKNYKWQYYDNATKRWDDGNEKYQLTKFSYNKKGDPVKIKRTRYLLNGKKEPIYTRAFKYKYSKKGVKKVRTESFDVGKTTAAYKKGSPVSIITDDDGYDYKTKYKTKNYYAKYYYNETLFNEIHSKITIKYKIKFKKGLPVRITWKNSTESGAAYFNTKGKAKGYLKKTVSETSSWKNTYTYRYKFKKGRPSTVNLSFTGYDKDEKSTSKEKQRVIFSYTKKTVKEKRYFAMMNAMLSEATLGDDGSSRQSGEVLYGDPYSFVSCWF